MLTRKAADEQENTLMVCLGALVHSAGGRLVITIDMLKSVADTQAASDSGEYFLHAKFQDNIGWIFEFVTESQVIAAQRAELLKSGGNNEG